MNLESVRVRLNEIDERLKVIVDKKTTLYEEKYKLINEKGKLINENVFRPEAISEGEWKVSITVDKYNGVRYYLTCAVCRYDTPTLYEIGHTLSSIIIEYPEKQKHSLSCKIIYEDSQWREPEDCMVFAVCPKCGISKTHFIWFIATYNPKIDNHAIAETRETLKGIIDIL